MGLNVSPSRSRSPSPIQTEGWGVLGNTDDPEGQPQRCKEMRDLKVSEPPTSNPSTDTPLRLPTPPPVATPLALALTPPTPPAPLSVQKEPEVCAKIRELFLSDSQDTKIESNDTTTTIFAKELTLGGEGSYQADAKKNLTIIAKDLLHLQGTFELCGKDVTIITRCLKVNKNASIRVSGAPGVGWRKDVSAATTLSTYGDKGAQGASGKNGRKAGNVTIIAEVIEATEHWFIVANGGKGGRGQNGGDGVRGKDGTRGKDAFCDGKDYHPATAGEVGGPGGDGGDAGKSGKGGKAGTVSLSYFDDSKQVDPKSFSLAILALPGVGGEAALGGQGALGGMGGATGASQVSRHGTGCLGVCYDRTRPKGWGSRENSGVIHAEQGAKGKPGRDGKPGASPSLTKNPVLGSKALETLRTKLLQSDIAI